MLHLRPLVVVVPLPVVALLVARAVLLAEQVQVLDLLPSLLKRSTANGMHFFFVPPSSTDFAFTVVVKAGQDPLVVLQAVLANRVLLTTANVCDQLI